MKKRILKEKKPDKIIDVQNEKPLSKMTTREKLDILWLQMESKINIRIK
jgi:hypothetical protein